MEPYPEEFQPIAPHIPPPSRKRRLMLALLAALLGALAGALASGLMPAGLTALAPLAGGGLAAASANRALTMAWQRRRQEQEHLIQLMLRRQRDNRLIREQSREKDQPTLTQEQQADLDKAATTLSEASSLAASLPRPGRITSINGVDVPDYVLNQLRRRYDPSTLTRDQLQRAVNAAFVDGSVFDDEHASHGFDDELHATQHEQASKPRSFVEALEDEKKTGNTHDQKL